jgi:hypothetical protein
MGFLVGIICSDMGVLGASAIHELQSKNLTCVGYPRLDYEFDRCCVSNSKLNFGLISEKVFVWNSLAAFFCV